MSFSTGRSFRRAIFCGRIFFSMKMTNMRDGEERSLIPGFKTVVMRDVILQPGAKTKEDTEMMNAMVCHIAEGELRVVQDGKSFTVKKNYVWTCNTGTKEHVANDSNAVAIMRITDLKA